MKLEKSFITSEKESKIHWSPNGEAVYSVVNKDAKNAYGEYPGWKVVPSKPTQPSMSPHTHSLSHSPQHLTNALFY